MTPYLGSCGFPVFGLLEACVPRSRAGEASRVRGFECFRTEFAK